MLMPYSRWQLQLWQAAWMFCVVLSSAARQEENPGLTKGIKRWMPEPNVLTYFPKRSTT